MESAYIPVAGRIFEITPRALTKYKREYGLGDDLPFHLEDCLEHIRDELKIALESEPTDIGRSGLTEYRSTSLIFKLVGRRVLNVRISTQYAGHRKRRGEDGRSTQGS